MRMARTLWIIICCPGHLPNFRAVWKLETPSSHLHDQAYSQYKSLLLDPRSLLKTRTCRDVIGHYFVELITIVYKLYTLCCRSSHGWHMLILYTFNLLIKGICLIKLSTTHKFCCAFNFLSLIYSLTQLVLSLHWRHNDHDGVSNHQPHRCLLNRLFKCRSKKTSKLRVTGLCAGNSPATGEFPTQMASYAENVSIWWRHHVMTWWCQESVVIHQL